MLNLSLPDELRHFTVIKKIASENYDQWFNTIHYYCFDNLNDKLFIMTIIENTNESNAEIDTEDFDKFHTFLQSSKNDSFLCKTLKTFVDEENSKFYYISEYFSFEYMRLSEFIKTHRNHDYYSDCIIQTVVFLMELIVELKVHEVKFKNLSLNNIGVQFDPKTKNIIEIKVLRISLIPHDFKVDITYESDIKFYHINYYLAGIALYGLTGIKIENTGFNKNCFSKISAELRSKYSSELEFAELIFSERKLSYSGIYRSSLYLCFERLKKNAIYATCKHKIDSNTKLINNSTSNVEKTVKKYEIDESVQFCFLDNFKNRIIKDKNDIDKLSISSFNINKNEKSEDVNSKLIEKSDKNEPQISNQKNSSKILQKKHDFGYSIPYIEFIKMYKPKLKISNKEIRYNTDGLAIHSEFSVVVINFALNGIANIEFSTNYGKLVFEKFSEVNLEVNVALAELTVASMNFYDKNYYKLLTQRVQRHKRDFITDFHMKYKHANNFHI